MSFASNVRSELARELCPADKKCCAKAELAAALLISDGISYHFGREAGYSLTITAGEAATVRHYFQLLKRSFGISAQLRTLRSNSLKGRIRYQLSIPGGDALQVLMLCGLFDTDALFGKRSVPREDIVEEDCCRRALIKSAFMIGGGMANPAVEYHLEFSVSDEEFADYIVRILTIYGISAKVACRKSKYVVYLKRSEDISDLLTLMGATQALLDTQNVRVKKDVSNRVNRQVNCDTANINRVTEAAQEQLDAIHVIENSIGLDALPPKLREIAEARLVNESASLTALGEMLPKPIGKSGVKARILKIMQIAEQIKTGDPVQM